MRSAAAATVLLACSLAAPAWAGDVAEREDPTFYLGGIQVNEPDHDRWLDTVRSVGMNTVAVTVYAMQGDWDTDHLWFEEQEPAVLDEIRRAKARGLAVVLILRVAVDHKFPRNKFIWHGMIMPKSDEAIVSWFDRYREFVVKWARVAEEEGVDLLGIGSEMNALASTLPITRWGNFKNYYGFYWYQRMLRKRSLKFADRIKERHLWVRGYENYETLEEFLQARFRHNRAWAKQAYLRKESHRFKKINERRRLLNDQWVRLIEKTRAVYRGKLTYAANFDQFHEVGFWRHLDRMGINSYFSLRGNINKELTSEEETKQFTDRWQQIFDGIGRFKSAQGLAQIPFLFTEIGYTFRRHSTVEPWAHGGFSVVGWGVKRRQLVVWDEQPVDYEERQLALSALETVHRKHRGELTGILYWKLSTLKQHEEIEPFVLHIGPDSTDPLQPTLAEFAESGAP